MNAIAVEFASPRGPPQGFETADQRRSGKRVLAALAGKLENRIEAWSMRPAQ